MAVAIRMKRGGRTHRPHYRIEAIERRNARNGRSLEVLGTYNPFDPVQERQVQLKVDRIQHWIDQGARPSDTVASFLRKVDVNWKPKTSRRAKQRAKKRAAKQQG